MPPSIRTVARCIVLRDGALLVIRYGDGPDAFYATPGGGQRHGERLDVTLVREVAEETGAIVRVGRLRFVRECVAGPDTADLPADYHGVELFFECDLIAAPREAALPDLGQAAVEWRTSEELRSLRFYPASLLDALVQEHEFGYLGAV